MVFKINECSKCVYVRNTNKRYVTVRLYVDDILIIGSNNDIIKTTKKMLNKHFDMKDMGIVDVILGMKITKTSEGYALSKSHYIEKILNKFSKDDNHLARTPVDVNLYLSKNVQESISQFEYTQIIESLMYLMNYTRPDIAHVISKLNGYISNLRVEH